MRKEKIHRKENVIQYALKDFFRTTSKNIVLGKLDPVYGDKYPFYLLQIEKGL